MPQTRAKTSTPARTTKSPSRSPRPTSKSSGGKRSTARASRSGAAPTEKRRSLTEAASDVVHRAAAILEEEIAAGIVAAKQVEERFLHHADLQGDAPSEVMSRLRKDAHEVVDVFIDFLVLIATNHSDLTGRMSRALPPSSEKSPEKSNAGAKTSVGPDAKSERVRFSMESGNKRRATVKIQNRSRKTQSYAFSCTDFIDESARRIPASCLSFEPNQITLAANASARVEVRCVVPVATPKSLYAGLILWGSDGQDQASGEIRVS
jgi:hypothetical protein